MDQLILWNSCHLTALNQGMQFQFHFYQGIYSLTPLSFCFNLESDVISSTNPLETRLRMPPLVQEWSHSESLFPGSIYNFKVISSTTKLLNMLILRIRPFAGYVTEKWKQRIIFYWFFFLKTPLPFFWLSY